MPRPSGDGFRKSVMYGIQKTVGRVKQCPHKGTSPHDRTESRILAVLPASIFHPSFQNEIKMSEISAVYTKYSRTYGYNMPFYMFCQTYFLKIGINNKRAKQFCPLIADVGIRSGVILLHSAAPAGSPCFSRQPPTAPRCRRSLLQYWVCSAP